MHLALGVYLGFFALTALMGIVFLFQGAFEAVMAAQHRPQKGRGWLALNGAATLILGVLLIAGLPGTALWTIGLFLGLNFLTTGIAFVALSQAASAD